MSGKPYQFVDTNILVYAHDSAAGQKHERAKALIQSLWDSQMGCLSIQVLQEFYVTITRKVARPLSPVEASQIISNLGAWRLHTPQVEDVLAAIQIQTRYQLSFWDALIIQSANQLACEIVWSEDLNAGQTYSTVRVENPLLINNTEK